MSTIYLSNAGSHLGSSVMFSILGLFVLVLGVSVIVKKIRSRNWPFAIARVVSSDVVQEKRKRGAMMYSAEITYEYKVDGVDYSSDNIDGLANGSSNPEPANKTVLEYPVGRQIEVYYNPSNPKSALVDRSVSLWNYAIVLLGLIFSSIGAYLFITNSS